MKKILLISPQDVISNSLIEENVDVRVLAKTIAIVQSRDLQAILGVTLYNQTLDAVEGFKLTGGTLNSSYSNLIDAAKPFIIAKVAADFIILNSYKFSTKGLVKLNDNSSTALSNSDIESIKKYHDNLVSTYKSNLLEYLRQTNLLNTANDTSITTEATGWFMGSTYQQPNPIENDVSIEDYIELNSEYTYQHLDELKNVLIISQEEIKANSVIEEDVDARLLSQTIKTVQDVNLRPILGEELYIKLLDTIYQAAIGATINSVFADLVSLIKPYLINKVVAEFIIPNQYKFSNKGLIKLNDNSSTAISNSDLESIKDYYDNISTTYKSNLIAFLNKLGIGACNKDENITADATSWFIGEGYYTPANKTASDGTKLIPSLYTDNDTYMVSGTLAGNTLVLTDNIGTSISIELSGLTPATPTLQMVTDAGNTSDNLVRVRILQLQNDSAKATLIADGLTESHNYYFPNKEGTFALREDLPTAGNGLTRDILTPDVFRFGGTITEHTTLKDLSNTYILTTEGLNHVIYKADNNESAVIKFIRAAGQSDSPISPFTNNYLGVVCAGGYDQGLLPSSAALIFQASEDFSGGTRGTRIFFNVTQNNSEVSEKTLILHDNKDVEFRGYPSSRNDGNTSKALFVDIDGLVKYGNIISNNTGATNLDKYSEKFVSSGDTIVPFFYNYISGSVRLYRNGLRLRNELFSAISGDGITLKFTPEIGDVFFKDYKYIPVKTLELTFNKTGNNSQGLYVIGSTGLNMSINWGDGDVSFLNDNSPYNVNYTYFEDGDYNANILCDDYSVVLDLDIGDSYGDNRLKDINGLELFSSLQGLHLNQNLLTSFNPSIALPNSLLYFNLANNLLTSFNPSIALPNTLQQLYLDNNQITSFNPSIALPNTLQVLYLNNNQITSFNPSIALPNTLQVLYLNSNQLTSFNPSIALPNALQVLVLDTNQITSFNPSIALPNSLKQLYLLYNQLTSFNPTIALPNTLKLLYLSSNLLTSFNPSIALPDSLQLLDLGSNQLTSFNPSIPLPNTLEQFFLENNQLSVTAVNNILIILDNLGYSGSTISVYLNNQSPLAAPSGSGLTAKNNLILRGCRIITD